MDFLEISGKYKKSFQLFVHWLCEQMGKEHLIPFDYFVEGHFQSSRSLHFVSKIDCIELDDFNIRDLYDFFDSKMIACNCYRNLEGNVLSYTVSISINESFLMLFNETEWSRIDDGEKIEVEFNKSSEAESTVFTKAFSLLEKQLTI